MTLVKQSSLIYSVRVLVDRKLWEYSVHDKSWLSFWINRVLFHPIIWMLKSNILQPRLDENACVHATFFMRAVRQRGTAGKNVIEHSVCNPSINWATRRQHGLTVRFIFVKLFCNVYIWTEIQSKNVCAETFTQFTKRFSGDLLVSISFSIELLMSQTSF